jgi:hypothetical protein
MAMAILEHARNWADEAEPQMRRTYRIFGNLQALVLGGVGGVY